LVREQVRKAREYHRLRIENQELKTRLADAGQINDIIGNSAAMQDIFRQIRQVADTEATVLIQGESGTGKELVARALHELSGRSSGPFVAVHLGALPDTLLESELFGHEKGSFSGASRRKPGCFEQAASGTLFLDEVTEMSPKSQVDLLRVLESRQYRRVGGEEVLATDIRLVAATNRNVQDLIQEGTFREDLYYRLNVIPLEVPPLRSRKEDIPLLIEHFMTYFCQRHARPVKHVSATAMEILTNAPWPGNIRQLRNLVERLVVTHNGEMIQEQDIPRDLAPSTQSTTTLPGSLNEAVEAFEKETIAAFLNANGMHREKTAKALGVSVRTLHYKMSRYGLH
jgi:two-component system NtrC family response regulator